MAGLTTKAMPWLLVLAVVAVYGNSLRGPFLFDDVPAIVDNPTIRTLWPPWLALNPPHEGAEGGLTVSGRPVLNLSFAVNYAISGTRVGSYHVVNLVIHAGAALLLFGVVRRTLLRPPLHARFGEAATSLSFLVALLWALHPLQTAAVTYVAQRAESLCGFFYLLTLYCFLRSAEPNSSRGWFSLAFAACLLGMGTKEVMVTAPVIVLLYDRTFLSGSFRDAWRLRGRCYLALAATWVLLAALVASTGGRGGTAGFAVNIAWWSYGLTQAWALVHYLALAIWPAGLVFDYGTTLVTSSVSVAPRLLLVVILVAGTGYGLWRQRVAAFAGAWWLAILAPTTSVIAVATQTVAEHRLYLPLAALVSLAVLGAHALFGSRALWFGFIAAVLLGITTVVRNRDYRDELTLWSDTVTKFPSSARAQNNLALALGRAGRLAEANDHFARAIALDPGYVSARYNWALALLDQRRTRNAVTQFEAAIRISEATAPTDGARTNQSDLADAHYQLAQLAAQANDIATAQLHFEATLRLVPSHTGAHAALGLLLARTEHYAAAAEHFRAVLRLRSDDVDAHANLGNVLLLQGDPRAAIVEYETVLRFRPDDARARENLQLAREALR